MRAIRLAGRFAGVLGVIVLVHSAVEGAALAPSAEGWLVRSLDEFASPPPPVEAGGELGEVRALAGKRTAADVARIRWWNTGGPAYRWNEIAVDELVGGFVTLPLAARHLALLHAAVDDAIAAAWRDKARFRRPAPSAVDASLGGVVATSPVSSYPSDFAAAATAAAEILGHILPGRAAAIATLADSAMHSRIMAGAEYPSDVDAGRTIGRKVAALAIARGKADGSDAKWTGSVPEGPDKWKGVNPIGPLAGTWRPWLLVRADELRPSPPPPVGSDQVRRDLAELKTYQRSPRSNHRAVYWEVFGGARAYALWNETARMKVLEYGLDRDAPLAARLLATLNIAFLDSTVACWEAKYAYWYIRPSQLDAEVKPAFPPPNHPSYPAAHGCLSTAAATVLASVFAEDREKLLAMGQEAAEARIWAGIHYRFDIDAGVALGRAVAEKALARGFAKPTP